MNDTREYSFEDPRAALKRHGLTPKHSWGQNFLVSAKAVSQIAAACAAAAPARIIEIGAGLGTLTAALLDIGVPVTAVERDRDMCAVLQRDFGRSPRFVLREDDAAKVDYRGLLGTEKGVIAGNLPYQITGRLIRSVVESVDSLDRAVVMVQEEVANRLAAPPSTSSRGASSVIVQARFVVKIAVRLKPTAFFPAPKVRSAVLTMDPLAESFLDAELTGTFFDRVVNAAFTARRKTLRNSLTASGLGLSSTAVESLLEDAKIDPIRRPETLSVQEFVELSRAALRLGKLSIFRP